jgi:hypothetical protein
MSINIYNNIKDFTEDQWNNVIDHSSFFISYNFLNSYFKNHKYIQHLFCFNNNNRFYGHVFNVNLSQLMHFSNNRFGKYILSFIRLRFFYFTNSFLTNLNSFYIDSDFNLAEIIHEIKSKIKTDFVVIPDFLFNHKKNNSEINNFIKVEVEEEMSLKIPSSWIDFESYKLSLKTKYRKRINNSLKRSADINVRLLSSDEIILYNDRIQELFNNVTNKANFTGPVFSVNTIKDNSCLNLYGYFLNEKLLAFSSEFFYLSSLYSYFVGIDYEYNVKYSLYERILCETIKNAILSQKNNVIFGRTANEFKSNFGAVPKKSFVYIYTDIFLFKWVFNSILKNLKPKKWIQRFPFKSEF